MVCLRARRAWRPCLDGAVEGVEGGDRCGEAQRQWDALSVKRSERVSRSTGP